MKLISVIVALFVVFQEFALALPPTSLRAIENATMFKLRNAFGKDSDTTLQPTDPCYWVGVGCSNLTTNNSILSIQWPSKSLRNTIPTDIGLLASLNFLDLTENNLTGTIPTELGQLPLSALALHSNPFNSTFPTFITNLTRITYLNLFKTGMQGTLPSDVWKMQNLMDLTLSLNNFNGSIVLPYATLNLTRLRNVDLSRNRFTGFIPEALFFYNLSMLILSNNRFNGTLPPAIENKTWVQCTVDTNYIIDCSNVTTCICNAYSDFNVTIPPTPAPTPNTTMPATTAVPTEAESNAQTLVVFSVLIAMLIIIALFN